LIDANLRKGWSVSPPINIQNLRGHDGFCWDSIIRGFFKTIYSHSMAANKDVNSTHDQKKTKDTQDIESCREGTNPLSARIRSVSHYIHKIHCGIFWMYANLLRRKESCDSAPHLGGGTTNGLAALGCRSSSNCSYTHHYASSN
jgi:hypothetical protein